MKYCVLSTIDTSTFPDVYDPLKKIAAVIELPAEHDRILEEIGQAEAYISSLEIRITRLLMEKATRLRVIATPSTGLDHIDLDYAAQRGIKILSLKDDIAFLDRITATAELAWALILSVVRRIPWAFEAAQEGDWARDRFSGMQLSGKTLGIIGYGRLGRMMAEIAVGFRMRIIACDIRDLHPETGVEMIDLDQLLKQSDIISIHVHLNDKNRGLIGPSQLNKMKPGAILINTSRGAIINESALVKALESGHLGGAGLDVIDGEWQKDLQKHPLIAYAGQHENLVITPHIGGVTHDSQQMAYNRIIEKLINYFQHD
jgi:D-3-phosphoglycerate dehydrogenase